jgi:hypothetical protein
LKQTEKLQSFPLFGVNLVDTLDADDKGKLGLGGNIEAVALFGLTVKPDLLPLCIPVLLDVLLRAGEDGLPLLFALCCLTSANIHKLQGAVGSSRRAILSVPKDG